MQIRKDTAITLRYKVADAKGKLIEEAPEPMTYLHGGYDNTLPKIEQALERTIPKSEFPPGVKVGGQLEGRDEEGRPQVFTVKKIKGDKVLLDGNHPLAGMELRFTLKVIEVRAASAEEIAHRHVHGAHGHHH